MKLSGAVAATSIAVTLAGLVGLVWFELPKGQRVARTTKLHSFSQPATAPHARVKKRAASPPRTPPATLGAPRTELVDLRAIAPAAGATPDEAVAVDASTSSAQIGASSSPSEPSTLGELAGSDDSQPPQPEATVALTLWVRDSRGAPLTGGEVRARWRDGGELHERTARANEHGLTTFDAPLGEGVLLEALAPGFAPASFGPLSRAQCAGAELGLTLERGARLTGVVQETDSSTPLTVVVWPAGNQGLALRFECECDEQRRFEVNGVWSGPLEALAIRADGAVSAVQSTDGDGALISLALQPTARRSGTVRDPHGRALAGAVVEAWATHGGFAVARVAATRTDADGDFELTGCTGEGLIQVHTDEWAPCWITPEGDGPTRVTLSPRRNLRVRLSGIEASAAEWSLSGWGIEDVAAHVFDGAELELRDLAPGPYSLALRGPDGATRHFNYTLTSSSDDELELRLR